MIEAVIAGAAATLIGVLSGQAMVLSAGRHRLAARVRQLEGAVPELISRSEVQNAFAQVAQIEAQRQAATVQQARAAAVFGGPSDADRSGLNANVNAQLDALNARLNRINQEFGLR
jgi:multidrug resistance efflux pump